MTDPTPSKPRNKGGAPLGNTNARSHGAPHGNNNALKHGFYSHTFSRAENQRLSENILGEFKDEEALIHTLLGRCAETMKDVDLSLFDNTYTLRIVLLAVGRLESLHRTRKVVYDNQTTLDQIWDKLKLIPPEVD